MSQSFDTAAAVRDARLDDLQHLATRADLAELEARLTWRLVAVMATFSALVVAAIKLIP
ncbi:MAG: hypothetical protein OXU64_13635 [Gemmatimonadota bacterium]|nr:hypothetical protein [Gemmatimonadota bacterium]